MYHGGHKAGSTPPVLKLDPAHPFGGLLLLTFMTWPTNQEKLDQARATLAGDTMGLMEVNGEEAARASVWAELYAHAEAHGFDPKVFTSEPAVQRGVEQEAKSRLQFARVAIVKEVFDPAGGVPILARATGLTSIVSSMQRTLGGESRHVGRALYLIAALTRFHPELPASINRAWAVMEADIAAGRYKGPSDRGAFMKMWSEGRVLSPLHAALRLYLMLTGDRGAPEEVTLKMLTTPEGLTLILEWAQWFRHWGSTFTPARSRSPLLPPADTMTFETHVTEASPPLEPLENSQLEAAKAYRAATTKFN